MEKITHILDKIYSDPTFAQSIADDIFPISISKKQGLFLNVLLEKYTPHSLLECGYGYGVSSLWIQSSTHKPKKHIIISESVPQSKSKIITKILSKQSGLLCNTNITSQYFMAQMAKKRRKFDCILLDADERFDGVVTDMYFATQIVKKEGIIIMRNIWNPSVRKAMLFYIKNLPYQIEFFSPLERRIVVNGMFLGEFLLKKKCARLGFLVLKLKKNDTRVWNHFIPF